MSGRSRARPKRSSDIFARTHHQDSNEPSSKKPRFDYRNPSTLAPDAPEDDAVLELDEIGANQTKRNAVNLDGYDSDSDNDNFNARAEAKAKAQARPSKDEEDNDMFADLDEEDGDDDEELQREGKKKKDVRFLDVDEIEGQVVSSKSGGHVSADFTLGGKGKAQDEDEETSSDSGDDELRDRVDSDVDEELGAGAKKKHAPKLDAFNMRSENEEGRFDESGNFVRKAVDPDARHDAWLEGLSKREMKKAREAHQQREEDRRKREMADDAIITADLLGTLIKHLHKGETVLEALQRLNKGRPKVKQKPKWQKNKPNGLNSDAMDVDVEKPAENPTEVSRREAVEAITGAADQILTRGQTDIYDQERELLTRQYRRETGQDWIDPPEPEDEVSLPDTRQWEYRWADGRDGGERHGPYDGPTMRGWNDAGYFGEGVEFRAVGETEWSRTLDS